MSLNTKLQLGLEYEKCELKNSIDVYMDSKIKDFQVMSQKKCR
jgi:hypothetical protein